MIQVKDLSFSYTGRPFISGMSFSVARGEIFGFLGPSGAGKSTLQKILTGMLPGYRGSAMVNGVECRRRPFRRLDLAFAEAVSEKDIGPGSNAVVR